MDSNESVENNNSTTEKLLGGVTGKGFMPGQSGNPGGRPKKRVISDLYEEMLADPEFVGEVRNSIRKMVLSGRMVGQLLLKEMTERTEGKVVQPVEADINVSSLAERMALAEKRVNGE